MASPVSSTLISQLRKIKERPEPKSTAEERCDFCGRSLPEDHRHLIEITEKRFMCTCELCAVIEPARSNYKLIPQRFELLNDFDLPDELWSDFLIPVNMAFFVFNSNINGIVAYYPAAAGATESKLKMEPWKALEDLNPGVKDLTPDVEALLVNRLETQPEYFRVPIDTCYQLTGLIKTTWKGISGGREVQNATVSFFKELKNKTHNARPEF